jgi:hypothetical protein
MIDAIGRRFFFLKFKYVFTVIDFTGSTIKSLLSQNLGFTDIEEY